MGTYYISTLQVTILLYRVAKSFLHVNQCKASVQYLANIHRDRRQFWVFLYEGRLAEYNNISFVKGREKYLYHYTTKIDKLTL